MSKHNHATNTRRSPGSQRIFLIGILVFVCLVPSWLSFVDAADDPRQIIAEAQKRTDAKSLRYEGLLQVFDAKGKVSDKRWTLDRLGAHGGSKMILRFTAQAEVKGVEMVVVNTHDKASDLWMWQSVN